MSNQINVAMGEVNFFPEGYRELLIGCGADRRKLLAQEGDSGWHNLTTLDFNETVNPDVVWDLNELPLPFQDEEFDEIHAYEVLEHIGRQGDFITFFRQFEEFHRILKPGGHFFASVPCWDSIHAWGDPGHTRIINAGTLAFLERKNYGTEGSPMTDYRSVYKADFEVVGGQEKSERFFFVLKAIK
jgi:SAM-dependent methyltransferase